MGLLGVGGPDIMRNWARKGPNGTWMEAARKYMIAVEFKQGVGSVNKLNGRKGSMQLM